MSTLFNGLLRMIGNETQIVSATTLKVCRPRAFRFDSVADVISLLGWISTFLLQHRCNVFHRIQ